MLLGMFRGAVAGGGGGSAAHAYWRVRITAAADGSFRGLSELAFRATAGGANQATGGTASSSSDLNFGNRAALAFDGNTTGTGWLSASAGTQWIAYAFAAAVEVAEVSIWGSWNLPAASPTDFTIEHSDNGSDWTVAATVTGQTGWTASQQRDFAV